MGYNAIAGYVPLVADIVRSYQALRRKKTNREGAVRKLREEYENELGDHDQKLIVQIGLAMALCEKKELTPEIRDDAIAAIEELIDSGEWGKDGNKVLADTKRKVQEIKMLGDEAVYRERKIYVPDWQIGDTFVHRMDGKKASELGIAGYCLLLRKVGDYISSDEEHKQLVHASVCSPEFIPKSSQEMNALGLIRMMRHGDKYDYLGQLSFKSKKDEMQYGLEKIGSFPKINIPVDATVEKPCVAYPLCGSFDKVFGCMIYEHSICMSLARNGTSNCGN